MPFGPIEHKIQITNIEHHSFGTVVGYNFARIDKGYQISSPRPIDDGVDGDSLVGKPSQHPQFVAVEAHGRSEFGARVKSHHAGAVTKRICIAHGMSETQIVPDFVHGARQVSALAIVVVRPIRVCVGVGSPTFLHASRKTIQHVVERRYGFLKSGLEGSSQAVFNFHCHCLAFQVNINRKVYHSAAQRCPGRPFSQSRGDKR